MRVKIFPAGVSDAELRDWAGSPPSKLVLRTERVTIEGRAQPSLLVFYEEERILRGGHVLPSLPDEPASRPMAARGL